MLLLLLLLSAATAEILQTFFENPCAYGNMPDGGCPYRALEESSPLSCAVACTEDIACVAYTYPPCMLHSAEHSLNCSLFAQPDAPDTFVKEVRR